MDFRAKVIELLSKETKQSIESIDKLLTIPPKGLGDFAYPCFVLAKEQKKNPVQLSQELSIKLKSSFLERVESKGPYINLFLKNSALSESTLEKIFDNKLVNKTEKGKIMVEYSSPNTNKPLHLGHLRNNTLGLAIAKLLEAKGLTVIKANLVNDRGVHICKSMLAYKLFGEGKTPESEKMKSDHFVGSMYVKFSTELEKDPTLEEKAQEMLQKWEDGDKEILALWKKMNKWAIDGMKKTYTDYGTEFDSWMYESELYASEEKNKKNILEEGLKKGIFKKEDNGAISAVLEPELPNKVLLRGDGTSLYATNDLILTEYKFKKFNLDRAIWVVANEQDLYFKQLFKIFERLGRTWAKQCYHLSYGYVSLTTGKMKSREGTVVDADDLLCDMKNVTLDEIKARYPKLGKKEQESRAKSIALASIKFYLLKNDAKKDMVFDPKASISFDGETGPYIQYTNARAKSILRKAKSEGVIYKKIGFELLTHEKEKELITALSAFSESVDKSWTELSLHPIAHNLLSISEKFNSYYHDVPILKGEDKKLISARLALVEATTIVITKGFEILDIDAIEKM